MSSCDREVENGYTFRMGDHEITMRDSFAAMLDTNQLTDCLLICHSQHKESVATSATTDCPPPPPPSSTSSLTNGHNHQTGGHRTGSSAPTGQVVSDGVDDIVRTHRVILSASSDYFRSIFNSGHDLGHTGVVAVVLTNVDFDDLKSIIDFIYKGQVSVGQSRIHRFLASAQMLMIKGLMNIKLVSNDNQPLDESNVDNQAIQKLKNEKRCLEQELRTIKELEKTRIEKIRRETESELKKKLELEKTVLHEEKQRFEVEKMKFTIEKEVFEKNRTKDVVVFNKSSSSFTNNSNNGLMSKHIVVNVSRSADDMNDNKTNEITVNTVQRIAPKDTPTKSGPTVRMTTGFNSSTNSSQKHSSTETIVTSMTETTVHEIEGRQLRKRIKLGDNEVKESMAKPQQSLSNKISNDQKMEVEDEDEEVYEVDFSGLEVEDMKQTESPQTSKALLNTSGSMTSVTAADVNCLTSSPQSAAIVASVLACHQAITTTAKPSQIMTRTLRRSTSSLGSASTQSLSGENGVAPDGDTMCLRRKAPGRTSGLTKELENSTDVESSPLTRNRRQSQTTGATTASHATPPATEHLYACPYCPQVYHVNQSLQDHINGVHLNSKTQYICDYCGKVYTYSISLKKHLRTAHPDEPIPALD